MSQRQELIKELHNLEYSLIGVDKVADFIIAREREQIARVVKDISDFALNIKTKESSYNDGYCDGMLKATKFMEDGR